MAYSPILLEALMGECIMKTAPQFYLRTVDLSLSAKGAIAFWLAVPVGALILAIAWRVVSR